MTNTRLLLFFIVATIHITCASPGDRDPTFRACVFACGLQGCIHYHGITAHDGNTPPCVPVCDGTTSLYRSGIARYYPWTCEQECRYQCMWQAADNQPTTMGKQKYYGKWPFVRIWGAQEAAAVVFSLANLVAHVIGLRWLHHTTPSKHHKTAHKPILQTKAALLYTIQGIVACMSWAAAAVFHTRDTLSTERVDYFLADAVVFTSCCCAMLRVWAIPNASIPRALLITCACIILFARHWYYMTTILFDYGFNMWVCLTLGVANACIWLTWAWRVGHPARHSITFWFVGLFCCMVLEVFDFAPMWGVLDAHALWHACTIVLTLLWYRVVLCVDVGYVWG